MGIPSTSRSRHASGWTGTRRRLGGIVVGSFGAALLLTDGLSPTRAFQATERTVDDAFGPVTVPEQPERVIAVGHHDVGNMLALGVLPIGMAPEASEFPLPGHAETLRDVPNVRADNDWVLNLEKTIALDPDLILEVSGQEDDPWNEEQCRLTKAAATTLCFEYGYTTEAGILQNMRNLGLALGREAEAEAVIADYEARVAALREKIADAGAADRPVAAIFWQGGGNFFVPVDRSSNVILATLGIAQPSFQADPVGTEVTLSFENLSLLNEEDIIIVFVDAASPRAELEASPVWQLLDPVQRDRVVFLDGAIWNWEYLPAMMPMLDDIDHKVLPVLTSESQAG